VPKYTYPRVLLADALAKGRSYREPGQRCGIGGYRNAVIHVVLRAAADYLEADLAADILRSA
jgi:hypothetical protein